MANDKFDDLDEGYKAEVSDSAVRARNRTVMLTPEITGQVRARLSRDSETEERSSGSFILPGADDEFTAPVVNRGYQSNANASLTHGIEDGYIDQTQPPVPPVNTAPNPISRETHQVSPFYAKPASAAFSLPEQNSKNTAPQRRETVTPSYQEPEVYQEHVARPDIESSLPYIREGVKQPLFEEASAEEASVTSEDSLVWTKITPVVGFLVSFDKEPNGEVFFIRSGRAIVSSQVPNGGNFLLLQDESVSPMHAIMRITEDAQIQILDNLSEFGTTVVRPGTGEEFQLSGDKAMVHHGDLIRFGKRTFSVCLIGTLL